MTADQEIHQQKTRGIKRSADNDLHDAHQESVINQVVIKVIEEVINKEADCNQATVSRESIDYNDDSRICGTKRKADSQPEDDEEKLLLRELEQKFAKRYTFEDEGYRKRFEAPPDPPPIVENWVGKNNNRDRSRDRNRDWNHDRNRDWNHGRDRGRDWNHGRDRNRDWNHGRDRNRNQFQDRESSHNKYQYHEGNWNRNQGRNHDYNRSGDWNHDRRKDFNQRHHVT